VVQRAILGLLIVAKTLALLGCKKLLLKFLVAIRAVENVENFYQLYP
jgi:hypothetical protein